MVARDDPELKALLEKFVTVRCVQMGGVDLGLFQFDPMLSWSVFFMNGDKTIYGRFGSAHTDAKRSKKDSNSNHTLAGLKEAMRGALEVHEGYTTAPQSWKGKLAGKTGAPWPWKHAEKTPAARKYKRLERIKHSARDTKGCVHCHEVQRLLIDSCFMKKKPVTDAMLWMYPHPEWIGITLDRDQAATVTKVEPDSPAAQAGLQVGDRIRTIGDQPILSPADVTWVLHQTPDVGARHILGIVRDGEGRSLTVRLADGWRRQYGDFAWRYRIAGYAMWLWAGATLQDHAEGVRIASHAPWWFKKDNKDARKILKPRDVIVAVDGKDTHDGTRPWTRSTYLAYLMREKAPGSTVRIVLIRDKERLEHRFKLPKPRPELLGH